LIDCPHRRGLLPRSHRCAHSARLPLPPPPPLQVPPGDLAPNLWQGMKCYVGLNSQSSDNCGLAPLFTNVYILFNLGYNILIILMLKYGSSNILWLCLTIQVRAPRVSP
jgi:hypothetical protein